MMGFHVEFSLLGSFNDKLNLHMLKESFINFLTQYVNCNEILSHELV